MSLTSFVQSPSIDSSLRPPALPDPREDEITAEILTGEDPRYVVRLPPRDRGTLVVLSGATSGAAHAIEAQALIVGRSASAGLSIQDTSLSRRHARFFRLDGAFYVQDLRSRNGTFVNGERVSARHRLADGDRIQAGLGTVLRFRLQDLVEQRAAQDIYIAAVRDPLTSLFNRRYLDERLAAEHAFATRHGTDLSVMVADIDDFKRFNDAHGHAAGDAVIRVVALTLQRLLRREDVVARYGGEEFCAVARGLDQRNATIVAERCRKRIASLALPWEQQYLSITVSIGVATLASGRSYRTPQALVEAADRALYRAKQAGRDRVCEAPAR